MSGIIASKKETVMEVKFPDGTTQQIKMNEVASKKEMKTSLMPEGLYQNMSNEDLANLLEYLESLKKK